MAGQTIVSGTSVPLTPNALTYSGFVFAGWATSAANAAAGTVTYQDHATFLMGSADVTLYAVWVTPHKVIFNNGSANATGTMVSQAVGQGLTAALTGNLFTNQGYYFKGWASASALAAAGTVAYADASSLTMGAADVTLYAVWSPKVTVFATLPLTYTQPYYGYNPCSVVSNGTSVWIGDKGTGTVYEESAATGAVLSTTTTYQTAYTLALDGTHLWLGNGSHQPVNISQYLSGTVSDKNPPTIDLSGVTSYPCALTYDPAAQVFWLVNSNGSGPYKVWKVNLSGVVLDSWLVDGVSLPTAYGVSLDIDHPDQYLWIATRAPALIKVSIATHSTVATYDYDGTASTAMGNKARTIDAIAQVAADKFWALDEWNGSVVEVQLH